jgi:23S rRNA (cytidine1920-2'-O)/16S rRNA (cytidine1409-2'-O)-methyltransferase
MPEDQLGTVAAFAPLDRLRPGPPMPAPTRFLERVDLRLVREGLATDVKMAASLVLAGKVMIGERKVQKVGDKVPSDQPLRLLGGTPNPYVSRGGLKLEGALRALAVDPTGLRCIDVGAATGGFTDCLLQHGALEVIAIDVGHGLLHDKLRKDTRVHVRERTHARELTAEALPWPADLLVLDVSFIGARQVLPALVPLVRPGGRLLLMVKPQFELAREQVPQGGVVTDDAARWQSVTDVEQVAHALGCTTLGRAESEVPGPSGNREIFLLLERPRAVAGLPDEPWLER